MKQLISDIKARLAEKVTALRYIDEDWGQLDYYASDAPVKWPCALITITQAQWSNQGRLTQTGIADVSIRIADLKLSNTNPKASDSQRAAANTIFDVMKDSFASLHGWTASSANGPLTRTQTRKVNREDGIREFEVIYSVQLIDTDAKPVLTAYPMTPEKITFRMGMVAPGSGELTPPIIGGGGILPPDPVPVGGEVYTTAEKTKLAGIATAATANDTDVNLKARANHTGTQTADTITDGTTNKAYTATEKTKLAGIATGANNYSHPNHSGDVTSTGDGATVIAPGVITYDKLNSSLKNSGAVAASDVDWSAAAIFTKTISATTTFTFSNLQSNKVITLLLTGNFTVNLPAYCKRISGTYNGAMSNYIQFHCVNSGSDTEDVWFTINQAL